MSLLIEATPFCNLNCKYCYVDSVRKNEIKKEDIDLESIKNKLRELSDKENKITLHGGEPLLTPPETLRDLLEVAKEEGYQTSIQTNASLINDEHIKILKEFDMNPGVSLDGPGELNGLRQTLEGENSYEKVMEGIKKLQENGISCGIISVLTKQNAGSQEKRDKLKEWLLELDEMGISGHFNRAIIDDPELKHLELTEAEMKETLTDLGEFVVDNGLKWGPWRNMIDNLLGFPLSMCNNSKCDFYATHSAKAVLPDGGLSNCGKTWKDGIQFLRWKYDPDPNENDVRYQILSEIPKSEGGCKGCRYWRICYGDCPSQGKDGDWRNKGRYCAAKFATYKMLEEKIKNLFPHIKLVPDLPEGAEPQYGEAQINPFEVMKSRSSAWRGGSPSKEEGWKRSKGREPSDGHSDGHTHTDGDIRHEDSDNPPGLNEHSDGHTHTDGDIRHEDGDNLNR